MQVAGVLIGALAAAASVAGWWLLAGVVVAAALAYCARPDTASPELPDRSSRLLGGLGLASGVTRVVVFATVFAGYLVPGQPGPAVLGFVAVVTAATATGVVFAGYYRRWCSGLLLLAGVAFVLLCAAIAPVEVVGQAGQGVSFAGVLAAAALCFPMFAGLTGRAVAVGAVMASAVAAGALWQLGPVRLGLSPTSLRDVLAAADAAALGPLLGAVVVLATGSAALLALTGVRDSAATVFERSGRRDVLVVTALAGALTAALAVLLSPLGALLLAAAFTLAEACARALVAREARLPAVVTVAGTTVLFGALVFAL
ncbi:hypothetical protein BAY61_07480 [Prauserella marina]|uniref:Uncharacterized protein n=1 Tax=Prauserella marina TaxID=530584 RepID=A0A222VLX4_9PSEU|nr:hypothetical protein [Prauserella marina]ASR34842.1 hypothetical protein BAY61_07480 [Prauserella marina]PWV85460.1 hypothetical protein DES30_1011487 [Prauserella marina]SDC54281.1 hypothetical protein SAMN05421630_102504 [Prauserella marina]